MSIGEWLTLIGIGVGILTTMAAGWVSMRNEAVRLNAKVESLEERMDRAETGDKEFRLFVRTKLDTLSEILAQLRVDLALARNKGN